MEFEEFNLKRSQKNKQVNTRKEPINPTQNIENELNMESNTKSNVLKEPQINETKLKNMVAIGVIFSLVIFVILFFMLKGGTKSDMFDASNKTKSEVISEFKSTFNKDLTDANFVLEDGGLRSKKDTVFKQTPSYGSKFDPNQDISEFIFTINRADSVGNSQIEEEKKENSTQNSNPKTAKTYVIENYMFKPFAQAKEKLANLNAKYTLEFKLTNQDRLEGIVSNQNYLEKTVLNTDDNKLVLTIYTKDPATGPKRYSVDSKPQTHTNFDENDTSNPNIAKDKTIYWSWKQGDKVDFRSYNGDVPLVCYERVCYYDGNGKPTEKTIKEQLGQ